jgi:alpha-ribazole phosphatase
MPAAPSAPSVPDRAVGGLLAWRHPRARGAEGRCIGRTDLAVDPRKARRLAHRIRAERRRRLRAGETAAAEVWVSPRERAQAVGRWLARWGWRVHVDARLAELDFGAWDGRAWRDIAWAEVEAWQADLWAARPGGDGEPLSALAARAWDFVDEVRYAGTLRLAVTHGGWLIAAARLARGTQRLDARDWPAPPRHGEMWRVGGDPTRDSVDSGGAGRRSS